MAETKEVFGRQVVFVNPSYLLKTLVIQKLLELEYEVYFVESPREAKAVLHAFPDALCLFDIDSAMTVDEYLNLIVSIEKDPAFANVLIGVLSRKANIFQRKCGDSAKIAAGYINSASNKDALLEVLVELFTEHNIKGRRQYVRVSLDKGAAAQFFCKVQGLPCHIPLRDISSCGFACEAVGFPEAAFTVNSVVPGELQLDSTILPCTCVLFAKKVTERSVILVMLFAQSCAWSNKKTIRGFIADRLQKIAETIVGKAEPDTADYSNKEKKEGEDDAGSPAAADAPEEPAPVQYAPEPDQPAS